MSTLSSAVHDSATLPRRDIRHSLRYPMMTISTVLVPVFFLLLFVGVFSSTLRAGLGPALPGGGHYIDYLAPGIILMTASTAAEATAISVCADMTKGIIARFRTMPITRTSVLTGQVLGSLIQALISVTLVVAVALAFGFRPTAIGSRRPECSPCSHWRLPGWPWPSGWWPRPPKVPTACR